MSKTTLVSLDEPYDQYIGAGHPVWDFTIFRFQDEYRRDFQSDDRLYWLNLYEKYLRRCLTAKDEGVYWRTELDKLRGKRLACQCPLDAACHGEVIIELMEEFPPLTHTRVININNEPKFDVYIGRAMPAYGLKNSIWACPYHIGRDGSREVVLAKYEARLRLFISKDLSWKKKLLSLVGKILGCWCNPAPCHGHVIVKLINEILEGKL